MTKTEIELLMTRDVDEVSEIAVAHPTKELSITLKNAAALLARDEPPKEFEERVFIFKLLRFLQAALAGADTRVTDDAANEVATSALLVFKRNVAPNLNRAARDVLSVLAVKNSLPDIAAKHQIPTPTEIVKYTDKLRQRRASQLERRLTELPPKPQSPRAKATSKPKGLPH